ncbi:MAG: hypothetical protein KHX55_06640 [Proteobacteria bacterium]|nr:hypothetical protein [Pseudomonadota bacterium]
MTKLKKSTVRNKGKKSAIIAPVENNNFDILKITGQLSYENPLRKFTCALENGRLNRLFCYQFLSCLFLIYIWLLFFCSTWNVAKLLIALWGTYTLIRLQIKPYFEVDVVSHLNRKKDLSIYLSSISYLLVGICFALSFFEIIVFCRPLSWKSIGQAALLLEPTSLFTLEFLFIVSIGVGFFVSLYNIWTTYQLYQLTLLLRKETLDLKLFRFVLMSFGIFYLPWVVNKLYCNSHEALILFPLFSILPYCFFSELLSGIWVTIYLMLRKISVFINKLYNTE